MTWLRKMRPVLVALGLVLGIATLIGARSLTGGSSAAASGKGDGAPRSASGLVVLGLVDTDPPPVAYGLPPVLPSGTVVAVRVKDGDEVKVGQALYEFDATIPKEKEKQARAAVEFANTKVKVAEELVNQHTKSVESMAKKVKAAERKVDLYRDHYKLVEDGIERLYRSEKIPEKEWAERKKGEPNLYEANVKYDTALTEKDLQEVELNRLKAVDPQVQVNEAKAAVKQAEAQLSEAERSVELCVVTAKTAGIVEQITIGPGTTMGVGTRAPALWLIPNGPRVVRAEVEAEFAHRVGPSIVGKTVTIADHTDPKLTYSGVVRRVPGVFLLKRASAENFLGGDTRVLEVVIEVTDPSATETAGWPGKSTSGKPPLAVGQRVRVNLGQ
jgi:multidrug resistance efflux pump